jgi:hypothetical protein
MKIPDIIKSLSILFAKSSSQIKVKTLTVESLTAQIEDTRWALNSVESVLFTMSVAQLDTLYIKVCTLLNTPGDLSKSVSRPTIDAIVDMPKKLTGKAKSLGLIKAIQFTFKVISKLLDELAENVANILNNKPVITIGKIQMSHSLFLGVLETAKLFTNYLVYFVATMSHSLSDKNGIAMPRYMMNYITNHSDMFCDILNQLCNVSGRYSIINDITNIKSHGLDFQLESAEKIQSKLIFDVLGIENIFLSVFNLLIRPIALIGEVYIDIRHNYYEDIKEKKKWLEGHVAIMKMELDEIDHNDPKYIKTRKIITYYEDKISEMDKKLETYSD